MELLRSCGVDSMQLEWNIKGQEKGQPITLTMRWKPVKEDRVKRKSPSTIRHEKERTEKYFTRKLIEKSMDSMIIPKEETLTETETNSDSDESDDIKEESMGSMDEEPEQKKTSEKTVTTETVTSPREPERKKQRQFNSDYSEYSKTDSDQSTVTDTEWKKQYKQYMKVETTTAEESRAKKENLERMLQRTRHTPPWLLRKRHNWSKKIQGHTEK